MDDALDLVLAQLIQAYQAQSARVLRLQDLLVDQSDRLNSQAQQIEALQAELSSLRRAQDEQKGQRARIEEADRKLDAACQMIERLEAELDRG